MNYGRAMKVLLAARSMSQQDLAHRMEADEAFISRIARAKSAPSGRTLEKLAAALEVPMYLMVLLASDEDDLRGITTSEAGKLGKQLVSLLLATEGKKGQVRPRR